jgi:hypothetical protein
VELVSDFDDDDPLSGFDGVDDVLSLLDDELESDDVEELSDFDVDEDVERLSVL